MLLTPRRLYDANLRRYRALDLLLAREWRGITDDLDGSWVRVSPRVSHLVAAAQVAAARDGADSVRLALAEAGTPVDADFDLDPRQWAGWTDQGNPLDSLLYGSVVEMRTADVTSFEARKKIGLDWLSHLAREQVGAASRGASQVAVAVRPGVGYTRMVNPPCCGRCAVQAGKFFKWNTGFQRHPKCDCVHVAVAGGSVPRGYVDSPSLDQITDLTKAERAAIESGANENQVLNSRRTRQGDYTLEGTTKRGQAHDALTRRDTLGNTRQAGRLTPASILRLYGDKRELYLLALKKNGYIY